MNAYQQPETIRAAYQPPHTVEPFAGESELEVAVKTAPTGPKEIAKAGVICVFYICKLPFVQC